MAVFSLNNGSGLLNGTFTVGENVQVQFSKGNLLYQASTGIWRFAENQYDCMASGNANASSTYSGWIDLYCWGTSGWNSGAQEYQPYANSTNNASYLTGGSANNDLTGDYADADWAYHNAIANGGQKAGLWRCLTHEEYIYMMESRPNAAQKYAYGKVNGVNGLIILPDTWTLPNGLSFVPQAGSWSSNVYSAEQWIQMESAGAVFLPATGSRQGNTVFYVGNLGDYWSSTACDESAGHSMSFFNGNVYPGDSRYRCLGTSVRPVQVIQSTVTQTINLSAGWNWISTYIETENPVAMLQALESALGDNASQISSAELFTENDGGDWWGELDEEGIWNEQMYMILANTSFTIELQGQPANPANHAITINPGWNWIGFPCDHQMSIEEALGGFNAEEGDMVANSEMFTEFEDGEWFGDVAILIPGQGFMYFSNSTVSKMLVIGG